MEMPEVLVSAPCPLPFMPLRGQSISCFPFISLYLLFPLNLSLPYHHFTILLLSFPNPLFYFSFSYHLYSLFYLLPSSLSFPNLSLSSRGIICDVLYESAFNNVYVFPNHTWNLLV